jgi:hypothetical protein
MYDYFSPISNKNLAYGDIGSKTLVFAIYDFDRFSRHDQIGEITIPLNKIDLGKIVEETKEIGPPPGEKENVNFILFLDSYE